VSRQTVTLTLAGSVGRFPVQADELLETAADRLRAARHPHVTVCPDGIGRGRPTYAAPVDVGSVRVERISDDRWALRFEVELPPILDQPDPPPHQALLDRADAIIGDDPFGVKTRGVQVDS
jgi:hypothetical protein